MWHHGHIELLNPKEIITICGLPKPKASLILNKEAVNKAFCDLSTLIFRPLYDIGPISVLVNLNTLHNLIPLFNFS